MSRSGPFNPVCKEAPHAGPSVIEGMASREGMCREPQPMMKDRHVDIIGEMGSVVASLWVGGAPVLSGPLRPEAGRRTPEARCFCRSVWKPERPVNAIPLSLDRQRPWWRATGT